MNTNPRKATTGLFAAGILALAAVLSIGGGTSPNAMASGATAASAGLTTSSNTANASGASSPSLPFEGWTSPLNVSQSGRYDNTSSVGVSKTTGGVAISWEQREVASHNYVPLVDNSAVGQPFVTQPNLGQAGYKLNGNVHAGGDALGFRHVVFWQQDANGVCGHYVRITPSGVPDINQIIPNSCSNQKNVGMAVAPDGTVHVIMGWDLNNISYWRRDPSGAWSVMHESVPGGRSPKNITIGVTTTGTVMVAYVASGPSHTDVWTTVRLGTGIWSNPEDISSTVQGNPAGSAHLPVLYGDPAGGMRIAWSQITRYDSGLDSYMDDVFYREWVPATGWANQPIVQLTLNNGNSYNVGLTVDADGMAHVAWGDDTGRGMGNTEIYYAKGRGTIFTFYPGLFRGTFGSTFQKEPALDQNPPVPGSPSGNVHMSFSVNFNAKDTYYSYAAIVPIGTPTPTFTPSNTATPTVSPTPCPPGYFLDVHSTDYFYQAVTALSRAGIISGYGDCTFKPYNNITRGQAAKIVALAANLPTYNPATPDFRDVPTTNPFYLYIEAAYHANVISGYSCGSVGEPCPGLYYRPNNYITRGQFSKVVVLAFALTINTQGGPHFTDVPSNNVFYQYVETAFNDGLISGYADNTFRPNNNITRGQAAKIVFNAQGLAAASPTVTSTPGEATATPTNTPVVVTATPTDTPVVVTATPSNTPIVVTATATSTASPTSTLTTK